jgi:hypothetical protein
VPAKYKRQLRRCEELPEDGVLKMGLDFLNSIWKMIRKGKSLTGQFHDRVRRVVGLRWARRLGKSFLQKLKSPQLVLYGRQKRFGVTIVLLVDQVNAPQYTIFCIGTARSTNQASGDCTPCPRCWRRDMCSEASAERVLTYIPFNPQVATLTL